MLLQGQLVPALLSLLLAMISTIVSGQQLMFNRTSVTFDDTLGTGNLQSLSMMLASQPAASVFVQITAADEFIVSPCTLQFDVNNWNVMQQVTVTAPPIANISTATIASSLTFNLQTPTLVDRTCRTSQQSFPVFYNVAASQSCSVVSNALVSFDGESAVFQPPSAGSYYLMKSANLAVEARQFLCDPATNTYCIEAIGIKYFDAFATLSVSVNGTNNSTSVNGTTVVASNPTEFLLAVEQTGTGVSDVILITLNDGTEIAVAPSMTASGKMYLDATITAIGAYRSQVTGMCGNFDGIALSNSQFAAFLQANVPAVPTGDNIFACGSCGGLPTTLPTFACIPEIPPPGFCQVLSSTTTTTTTLGTVLPTGNVTTTVSGNITATPTVTSNITATANVTATANSTITMTLSPITTTLVIPTLTTTTITVTTFITASGTIFPTTYTTTVVYPTAILYPTVYPVHPGKPVGYYKPCPTCPSYQVPPTHVGDYYRPCSSCPSYPVYYNTPAVKPHLPVPQPPQTPCPSPSPVPKPVTCRPRPPAPAPSPAKDPHVQNGITSTDKVPPQQQIDSNKTTSGASSIASMSISVIAATISSVLMSLVI